MTEMTENPKKAKRDNALLLGHHGRANDRTMTEKTEEMTQKTALRPTSASSPTRAALAPVVFGSFWACFGSSLGHLKTHDDRRISLKN